MLTHENDDFKVDTPTDDTWGGEAAGEGNAEPVEEPKLVPATDLGPATRILNEIAIDENPTWGEKTAYNYDSYALGYQEAANVEAVADGTGLNEWASQGARYEWKEEYGDVAPADPVLEQVLFGEPSEDAFTGIQFSKVLAIPIVSEGPWEPKFIDSFEDAGLHPVLMQNIRLCRYAQPTPIQRSCIPAIMEGYDLISCAQTGSGKTAAFLIPILSKLMGKAKKLAAARPSNAMSIRGYRAEPLVLIVAPTRELATQIFNEARKFCYRSMLRPCVVYGGADSRLQRMELERGCDILIGTPGRLTDFVEKGNIRLRRVKYTVVDEADEMLDMGFEPQLRKILHGGDHNEDDDLQVLMFSATFPKSIRKLAKDFLADDFVRINVGRIGSVSPNVVQRIVFVEHMKKRQALFDLINSAPAARTLIFVNNKRDADSLDDYLYNLGLPTTSIHGDRNQREREDALIAFRSGKCPILIATGVASRGLDIRNVLHVINFDMVKNLDEYIHRIGRTGRIGNHGLATTFYNTNDTELAPALVKILLECKQEVPSFLEEFMPEDTENLNFDEASEPDEEDMPHMEGGSGHDAWGPPAGGDAWGGDALVTTDAGDNSW